MKVTMVDFNVRESKTYSIFIEDELCEIDLERKGDKMFYTFKINNKVDTPRNRERRKINTKHLKQTLLFFGGMIVVAVLISLGLQWIKAQKVAEHYSTDPNMTWTTATVSEIEDSLTDSVRISYEFVSLDGRNKFETLVLNNPGVAFLPVEVGDEFQIQYHKKHPYRHQLFLNKPTELQVRLYLDRAIERQDLLHPEFDRDFASCQVVTAYEEKGVRALSIIYYQDLSPLENSRSNSETYRQLMSNPDLQNAISENCDQ